MTRLLILFLAFALPALALSETDLSGKEIVDKAENSIKGKSSKGVFSMKIVRPDYEREMKMKSWWEGEKALIEIIAPAKDAGNKTLKIDNEMWNYLKNTETTMKVPPSMMLQSWNGSDLTNQDIVRESELVEDYDIKMMFEEEIAGDMCWKLELTPKPDKPIVWGKIYYWVRQENYLPALTQYYDEKGKLIRTMKFLDVKKMDDRTIPTRWKIVSETEVGQYTEFVYEDVKFNPDIPDRIFSYRELER